MMKKLMLIAASLFVTWPVPLQSTGAPPIAVIVNNGNDTAALSSGELSRIYTGKVDRWPDDTRIVVVNRLLDSEIRARFYANVLSSKPARQFFKPGSPIPFETLVIRSDMETRRFVARVPNAIGYVYLRDMKGQVKILSIDGALPGEAHYELE